MIEVVKRALDCFTEPKSDETKNIWNGNDNFVFNTFYKANF